MVRAWCVCVCVWCVCVWCSCAPFRARRQRRPLQAATKRRPPALVACGDGATSQSLERRCTDVHAHWLPTAATWSRTRLTARWHRSPRARHRITALVCPRPEHTKNGAACFRQTLHLPNCCSRAGAMWAGAMCSCCVRAIGTARAPIAMPRGTSCAIDWTLVNTVVRMEPSNRRQGEGEIGSRSSRRDSNKQ